MQKLRQRSYPQGKQALARLTTLAKTSSPPLLVSEVDERPNLGMLASPLLTRRRPHSEIYHSNRESSKTRSRSYQYGETRGDVLKQHKIESRLKMLCGSLIQKEKHFFLSIEIRDVS